MIKENQYYSYNLGELPKGCQYCVRGEKLVLFVTGICPRRCYFCPVSDEKFGKDVCFANERKVHQDDDLLTEAQLMRARGAGITGGDPLTRLDRTVNDIRLLKEKYGKEFHIHLYTSLNLVTEEALRCLSAAGLDEIRFHLDFDSSKLWEKLLLAKNYPWNIGVELPLIPTKEKELFNVIDFISHHVDFLVLNELEVADNAHSQLLAMGFQTKDEISYAVQGSLELGQRLLKYVEERGYQLAVHLCTAKLKDGVQLSNRLKREAQGMRKKFDIVTEEGLLVRGALYLPSLVPGFGYRRKLAECDKEKYIEQLKEKVKSVVAELQLAEKEWYLDSEKPRILISSKKIKPLRKKLNQMGFIPAIVKEYPTADQLEIEVELFSN